MPEELTLARLRDRHPRRSHALKASASPEELCVEALNGAGPLVTKATLKGAAQLVSVEARHVAWVRDELLGEILAAAPSIHAVEAKHAAWVRRLADGAPSPAAFEGPKTKAQVLAAVQATGFIRG